MDVCPSFFRIHSSPHLDFDISIAYVKLARSAALTDNGAREFNHRSIDMRCLVLRHSSDRRQTSTRSHSQFPSEEWCPIWESFHTGQSAVMRRSAWSIACPIACHAGCVAEWKVKTIGRPSAGGGEMGLW